MPDPSADNPFRAAGTGAGASAGAAGPAAATDDLPEVADLVSKTASIVAADIGSFLIAGLPVLGVVVVGTLFGLVLVYGGMFLGMLPGLALEDEGVTVLGSVAGLMLGLGAMTAVLMCVSAPMTASLNRAVWRHLETGERLSAGAAFSTFGQDFVRVILFQTVLIAGVMVGTLFCYLPGLVVAAAFAFAGPAIYIHRLSVPAAISLSASHLQRHPGWHLAFFGLSFVASLVLSYIPFVGLALVSTVHPVFVLLAYRGVYGNGELPRGYER